MNREPDFEMSDCVFESTEGHRVSPLESVEAMLQKVFHQLAPAFTLVGIQRRQELDRSGCCAIKRPLDILLEVARAEAERPTQGLINDPAVLKGASGEGVAA